MVHFKTLNSEYILEDAGDGAFKIVKGSSTANLHPGMIVRLDGLPTVGRCVFGTKVNDNHHDFHTSRVTEVLSV